MEKNLECVCGKKYAMKHHLENHQKTCEVYLDTLPKGITEPVVVEVSVKEPTTVEVVEDKTSAYDVIDKLYKHIEVDNDSLKILADEFERQTGKPAMSIECSTSISFMCKVLIQRKERGLN